MPDSANNAEIEDVLSSIRRLVAGEAAARPKGSERRESGAVFPPRPSAPRQPEPAPPASSIPEETEGGAPPSPEPALVLTPEDRVAEPVVPPRDMEDVHSQWKADAKSESVDSGEGAVSASPSPEIRSDAEGTGAAPAPEELPGSGNSPEAGRSTKRMPLLAQTLLQNRPSVSEGPARPAPKPPMRPAKVQETDQDQSEVEEAPFDDRMDEDLPLSGGEPVPMFRHSVATWSKDAAGQSPNNGPDPGASEAEAEQPTKAVRREAKTDSEPPEKSRDKGPDDLEASAVSQGKSTPHRRTGFAFGVSLDGPPSGQAGQLTGHEGKPPWAIRPQSDDVVPEEQGPPAPPVAERQSESVRPASLDEVDGPHDVGDRPREARTDSCVSPESSDDDVTGIFSDDDEPADGDAELRALISRIVVEELQGSLGERITRNVRKLVRREVQRALAARDFD